MSKCIVAPKYMSLLMTSPKTSGLIRKRQISDNPNEDLGFKESTTNQENMLTINFVKMKSHSTYSIHKRSDVINEKMPINESKVQTPLVKKSFHSKTNSISPQTEKLFEKLYVLGVEKNDIIENEKNMTDNNILEPLILVPKVLYQYPKQNNEEL